MIGENSKTVIKCVAIVAVMGSLSFAAVPFYNWFCRVTGFGGTTGVATNEADDVPILDQTIKVRFDANTDKDMPWEFKPEVTEMELRIGETGLAFYRAHNPTDHKIGGTASFNVSPFSAGYYFIKVECFCFTEQILEPGQTVMMPVTFYVDPEIVEDPEAKYVHAITLSYTFHETDLPQNELSDAAQASDGGEAVATDLN